MSILIKGMEMPKGSRYCKFTEMNDNWERVCTIGGRYQGHSLLLCDDCPLIEVPTPHGPLKDGDALESLIYERISDLDYKADAFDILRIVQDMSAIIEAEEGAEE